MSLLNGTRYGLSCSIWTRDMARAQAAARAARTGLVWLNSWFVRDLHTAFGGMKRSGVGREGGQLSLDFFSDFKTVTMPAPGGC
jgi:acyl-CoA reductase-like NAD-dependent aldehyde dehydrogenase